MGVWVGKNCIVASHESKDWLNIVTLMKMELDSGSEQEEVHSVFVKAGPKSRL